MPVVVRDRHASCPPGSRADPWRGGGHPLGERGAGVAYHEMSADRIHIYPVDKHRRTVHSTDKSEMCFCCPEAKQVCPESIENEQGDPICSSTCYRCGGSTLVDPYDEDMVTLIIHRHVDALMLCPSTPCYPHSRSSEIDVT